MPAFPAASLDVVVTSPPYNLGIRYRSYADRLPRQRYLDWTGAWIAATARWLRPEGSLFLNVGAKPTDPWTAIDIAQAARPHLHLQNTLHWIKSIAIDRDSAGAGAGLERDIALGHYKPINSQRFVNDCHEFIFQFSPSGRVELDRLALGVRLPGPLKCRALAGRWRRDALPREHMVHALRHHPEPRQGPAASGDFPPRLPEYCLRLHGLDRITTVADPFLGLGSTAVACATLGVDFVGIELDRGLPGRGDRANTGRAERVAPPPSAPRQSERAGGPPKIRMLTARARSAE